MRATQVRRQWEPRDVAFSRADQHLAALAAATAAQREGEDRAALERAVRDCLSMQSHITSSSQLCCGTSTPPRRRG